MTADVRTSSAKESFMLHRLTLTLALLIAPPLLNGCVPIPEDFQPQAGLAGPASAGTA